MLYDEIASIRQFIITIRFYSYLKVFSSKNQENSAPADQNGVVLAKSNTLFRIMTF